jgi:hypothetical protein
MTGTEDEVRTHVGDEREASHVPRLLPSAVVLLADRRRLPVRVFPPAAAGHPGAMRVEEWLDDERDLFPSVRDGEGSPTILNERQTLITGVRELPGRDGRS